MAREIPTLSLSYSTDIGTRWTSIDTRLSDTGHYKWTVPSTETSGALIKVEVLDIDGMVASDTSDATFAIDPPPPKSGQFFAPLAGDVLAPGSHHMAEWIVHDPWGLAQRPLTLEMTTNGGNNWVTLEDGLLLSDGIEWNVPALTASSDVCQLRLTVLSWLGDISVIDSGQFAIDVVAPTVTVEPIEERLVEGETVTVYANVVDDLVTKALTLHIAGQEGDSERSIEMTLGTDGRWTARYVPVEGDAQLWVEASDGVHDVSSETVDIDVSSAGSDPARSTTLALELGVAAIAAVLLTAVIAVIAFRRRT